MGVPAGRAVRAPGQPAGKALRILMAARTVTGLATAHNLTQLSGCRRSDLRERPTVSRARRAAEVLGRMPVFCRLPFRMWLSIRLICAPPRTPPTHLSVAPYSAIRRC
jgi:hypothetical protein